MWYRGHPAMDIVIEKELNTIHRFAIPPFKSIATIDKKESQLKTFANKVVNALDTELSKLEIDSTSLSETDLKEKISVALSAIKANIQAKEGVDYHLIDFGKISYNTLANDYLSNKTEKRKYTKKRSLQEVN